MDDEGDDCTCDNCVVYACIGCGKAVTKTDAIEYESTSPYPHSKWFCDLDCVRYRHAMLLVYITTRAVDPDDPQVIELCRALANIENYFTLRKCTDESRVTVSPGARIRISGTAY
jgi:hypothetical protein